MMAGPVQQAGVGLESRLREEQKEPCKKRAKKQKHRHISSGGDEGEASGDRHQSDMKGLKKRRKEKNPDGSDKDQRRRKRKKTKHRSDNPQEATTVVQSVEEGPSTNGNRSESVQSLEKRRESPSGSAAMLKRDASPARKEEWAKVGDRELALIRPPYPRRFYVEHPDIASMGEEEVQRLRNELGVSCDAPQYKPLREMWHAGFPETVAKALESFEKPSPIQAQAWPVALSGEDMIGIAATGSGKTLAFGLPALVQALAQGETNPKRPKALVMSPTRELAQQTAGVMAEAGEPSNVRAACVHGGEKKQKQRKELAKGGGCSLVVATPGRLVDLVESGEMALDRVTYFVLDEADRMLDLGFEEAMRSIGGRVRADRQTLMFSATWPERIRALASEFLANPIAVWVGGKQLKASHSVRQIVEVVKPHEKEEALDSLLQQYHAPERARVLVFALYKREAADLERALKRRGWECKSIHGDMAQHERSARVAAFKEGEVRLLIATDVAARGLDIPDVECVINYTFPLTTEDYVHRIGRTGRAGLSGAAHTLFTKHDKERAGELINVLREAGEPVPDELLKFGSSVKPKKSSMYGTQYKSIDPNLKPKKITFD